MRKSFHPKSFHCRLKSFLPHPWQGDIFAKIAKFFQKRNAPLSKLLAPHAKNDALRFKKGNPSFRKTKGILFRKEGGRLCCTACGN